MRMALIPLAEAAELVGVSKPTLYRKAASGLVSVTRDDAGRRMVDTSELERVFGSLRISPETQSNAVRPPETAVIQAQLDAAHQVIAAHEARIADLQADKARLWEQVEGQRLLLEHKPQEQHGSRFIEMIVAAAIVLVALTGIVILLR